MDKHGSSNSAARSAGTVGLAVMCSRVLGLVREQVFAGLFGAGRDFDTFQMAFRVPNLLRDLFAEGALSVAFITTLSKKIVTDGDSSAWRLANKVATLTVVFMSLVAVLGIVFCPQIIALIAGGFEPEKATQTILLARIMWPFILLVSLAALVMGLLNAKCIFGPSAMASSYFNLGSIVSGVLLGWWIDPSFGPTALIGVAMGTLIGGLCQLLAQLPALRQTGFRFRIDFGWNDEGVRDVLRLMGPSVLAASAVQINVLINSRFASSLADGTVSWLNIAFRLMQLPLGIFGVAIATVTLPLVSKWAALCDFERLRSTLARGMRVALALAVPSMIGLFLLAEPIISIIYEHGRFTAEMTAQTAVVLQCYAIGLPAYTALKVITPAFYAIDNRRTPMLVSFLSILMNLALNWFFTFRLGLAHCGLALSTGIVAVVNFLVLYELMRRQMRGLETARMLSSGAKMGFCGLLLGLVCWSSNRWLMVGWQEMAWSKKCIALFGTIAMSGAVYIGSALALKVDEISAVVSALKDKFRRTD